MESCWENTDMKYQGYIGMFKIFFIYIDTKPCTSMYMNNVHLIYECTYVHINVHTVSSHFRFISVNLCTSHVCLLNKSSWSWGYKRLKHVGEEKTRCYFLNFCNFTMLLVFLWLLSPWTQRTDHPERYLCQQHSVKQLLSLLLVLQDISVFMHAKHLRVSVEGKFVCVIHERIMCLPNWNIEKTYIKQNTLHKILERSASLQSVTKPGKEL